MFYIFLIYYCLFPLIVSFIISFILNKYLIFILNKFKVYQNVRIVRYKYNIYKNNVPTMGGIIILFILFFLLLFFFIIKVLNIYIFNIFIFFILNSLLGLLDDYIKCYSVNCNGLSILNKYCFQSFISILYIYIIYNNNFYFNYIYKYNLNFLYIILWYFLLIGTSNSVNLTDGLDGLVVLPLILNFLFLFIVSTYYYYNYLNFIFIKYLIILISVVLGYLISFLYYNFYPAKIFLGDTGSLSLGFLLGSLYIFFNKEFFLILNGFVFIIEVLSVILQIIWYKLFNKRIFLMSPIHHHFEKLNFIEVNIVFCFWLLSLMCFIISLFLFLKIYVYI